jgi:hypothetical protein
MHPSLHYPLQLMWLHSGEPDPLVMQHVDQVTHWQAHQNQGTAIKNTNTEANNTEYKIQLSSSANTTAGPLNPKLVGNMLAAMP